MHGKAEPRNAPCDAPTVGPGGATTYCCAGCEQASNVACPQSARGVTSEICRGDAVPVAYDSTCLPADPNADGTIPYCSFSNPTDGRGSAVTAPNLMCNGGGSPVESYYSEPNVNLGCSSGEHLSGNYHYGYCCSSWACNPTGVHCTMGAIRGAAYACGAAYPTDPWLACCQGVENDVPNSFDAFFGFCCATVPAGKCKPDPSVPKCIDPWLMGFSCTGSSTPREQLPSLICLAGTPASDGSTQYCCGG